MSWLCVAMAAGITILQGETQRQILALDRSRKGLREEEGPPAPVQLPRIHDDVLQRALST